MSRVVVRSTDTGVESGAGACLGRVREFARTEIGSYLAAHGEMGYPAGLVDRLRGLGVFGVTVSPEYGGLGWEAADVAQLIYELARGWQPLAGLVGTHLKLCRDVARHGTAPQQDALLPAMAAGGLICARAYHEKGNNGPELLQASIRYRGGVGVLNGHKNWVTNARHADRVIAIARDGQSVAAVIVDPRRPGVSIGEELPRPGMLGVSLAEVTFSGYEFDPDADVLGGRGHDIAESLRGHDMTGYVSRAVGSADAVHSWARGFVRTTIGGRPPDARGAIELRLGELSTLVSAMRVVWQGVTGPSPRISPDQAKVFCGTSLQEVIRAAVALCGGAGYAGHDSTLTRHYRDALALQIVGAPNDVLLSRIGVRELGE